MNVKINIKGFSNNKSKITSIIYKYPENSYSLRAFFEETVRITVREYKSNAEVSDKFSDFGQLGINMVERQRHIDVEQAIDNVIQNYLDGLVAVFIDGEQYEDCLEEKIKLHEMSEATFIRLTFLVGGMW